MNLTLKDFMEKVPLKDPQNAKRFLVFENDEGEELQVPVGPETIEAIARFVYRGEEQKAPPVDIPEEDGLDEPPPEGATTFGGDEEEEDDPISQFQLPPPTHVPESEDKVPSV